VHATTILILTTKPHDGEVIMNTVYSEIVDRQCFERIVTENFALINFVSHFQ